MGGFCLGGVVSNLTDNGRKYYSDSLDSSPSSIVVSAHKTNESRPTKVAPSQTSPTMGRGLRR